MKTKLAIVTCILALAVTSCTKCVTCTAYYANGYSAGKVAPHNQAVKVCDKADIHAYETGNNFTDPGGQDTLKYICK